MTRNKRIRRKRIELALSNGHKELYCYCLERSLPPLIERHRMSSLQTAIYVRRAERWYGRLLRFMT